jgi:hypothetical protein
MCRGVAQTVVTAVMVVVSFYWPMRGSIAWLRWHIVASGALVGGSTVAVRIVTGVVRKI